MLDSRSTFLMAFKMTNSQSHWLSFRRFKTVKMTANEIGNSSFETPSKTSSVNPASSHHRIDTRPEGTLLCVLAEGKRPKFFYLLWRHPGVHTALCTYVFLWKTSVCTPGWRHMMAYFHVSTRKISDKTSSEWHFWSCIYSVVSFKNWTKMQKLFVFFSHYKFVLYVKILLVYSKSIVDFISVIILA